MKSGKAPKYAPARGGTSLPQVAAAGRFAGAVEATLLAKSGRTTRAATQAQRTVPILARSLRAPSVGGQTAEIGVAFAANCGLYTIMTAYDAMDDLDMTSQ